MTFINIQCVSDKQGHLMSVIMPIKLWQEMED